MPSQTILTIADLQPVRLLDALIAGYYDSDEMEDTGDLYGIHGACYHGRTEAST